MDISRWALRLEYDGTGFVGWQKQQDGVSIQSLIEAAASRLVGNRPVSSITAGRTDAGVHASGMVIHIDFPGDSKINGRQIRDGMGYYLKPHRVVVLEAAQVSLDWSARFSAIWRSYQFKILNRQARPALQETHVWHVKRVLDVDLMQEGANYLLGSHDFTSFRAIACQARSAVRTLDVLTIHREGELVIVNTKARSFLHHQVRNMVGSLVMVGSRQWPPEKMREVLEARNRCAAGPTSPPDGLCLTGVGYPEDPFA
ncbi:tRNA pseudouridine(38-40) synthase TruA [Gluconobacter cerinus]|uniref:tRNA pseudouridine(38-40) synthase TruA n=1 Tax=Gluconobacter cerinus TaxID=38307 RepID=UPI001B8C4DAC|nr:tRNA pseudouridine(38-40) synthase TruA [Gluconobacter cerinus]MBS1039576.1 tRNA pseudouridine(38-40) synthase TruA [Gluconobacter cerinus]MBS1046249.1 tRNA pseudouridine(38-40) synthase TruA [Gluconobacter cerinus]